jgi:hypothetical protein
MHYPPVNNNACVCVRPMIKSYLNNSYMAIDSEVQLQMISLWDTAFRCAQRNGTIVIYVLLGLIINVRNLCKSRIITHKTVICTSFPIPDKHKKPTFYLFLTLPRNSGHSNTR